MEEWYVTMYNCSFVLDSVYLHVHVDIIYFSKDRKRVKFNTNFEFVISNPYYLDPVCWSPEGSR